VGVPSESVRRGLAGFRGAHRRLEPIGEWRGARLYDDYGHHPTEVAVTIAAARELRPKRLLVVFQPHRYSRFKVFQAGFARALGDADQAIVSEIYPSGEPNPGGLSARTLIELDPRLVFAPDFARLRSLLEEVVRPGDLVILMGAGDIGQFGRELVDAG
jgi:UDP-N-acetylmuramate--alanine ligase